MSCPQLTYRDLNQRANALARRLIAQGLRRGGHAWVSMPRGEDLAVVLLGILKAGGSYTWPHTHESHSDGISIVSTPSQPQLQAVSLDLTELFGGVASTPSPNLPVISRGSDIACVLRGHDGAPVILVPHDALTAFRDSEIRQPATWTGEPGAFDLWLGLVKGMTVVIDDPQDAVAAA